MWPWGHLAVAYLAYRGCLYGLSRSPGDRATVVLGTAALLPDIVDKSLRYLAPAVFTGRSVAHSAFVASAVCLLVLGYSHRTDSRVVGLSFVLAYASHLFADGILGLLRGDLAGFDFLWWPVTRTAPQHIGVTTRLSNSATNVEKASQGVDLLGGGAFFVYQIVLTAVALVVWWYDGRPGIATVRSVLVGVVERARTTLRTRT